MDSRSRKRHRGSDNKQRDGGSDRRPTGNKNPRRGGPGVLLTCEKGRERKCKREGLEILQYYYYLDELRNDVGTGGDRGGAVAEEGNPKQDGATGRKDVTEKDEPPPESMTGRMSLADEIALLRRGATADEVLARRRTGEEVPTGSGRRSDKSAPFAVYETGCKGTVFVMCTLPGCNLSSPIDLGRARHRGGEEVMQDALGSTSASLSFSCGEKRSVPPNEREQDEESKRSKKCKVDEADKEGTDNNRSAESQHALLAGKPSKSDTTTECAYPNSFKGGKARSWDPVDTVDRVVRDIEGRVTDAPSSRFVTRMIPMQATCYASMEEIKATAEPLIQKFLLPHAKSSDVGKNEGCQKGVEGKEGRTEKVTFRIAFKRRVCSNIRRDQVIEAVADLVAQLGGGGVKSGDEELEGNGELGRSSANEGGKDGALPSSFEVNLTNPDYTIQIEICRTLCGMSVVPNLRSYKNFNLFEIKRRTESGTNK